MTYFLGFLMRDVSIRLTEHPDYRWLRWSPPHQIQTQTVDPLLAAVEQFFRAHPERMRLPVTPQ